MSDKETSRLSRLVAILTQLQSKRLLTATEVARKFNISLRTVYRDIRALEKAGVPILTEEGKGYSLMDGYRVPPVMFTESEANAFITAEKLVLMNSDTSLTANYINGITKIKAVLRNSGREKAALLSDRLKFNQSDDKNVISDFLSSIQLAITNFNVIEIEYYSPYSEETTKRFIEPFGLINDVGDSWYLIAWCRLRDDYRLFRFDRMKKMHITDQKFSPHKITLQQYLSEYLSKQRTNEGALHGANDNAVLR